MAEKKTKRKGLIAALAVLVLALAVGGTVAWLTAHDQLTNEFTVGSIGKPDKEPGTDDKDDEDGEIEDEEETSTEWNGGYLFETAWDPDADHELTQGVAEPKNPNVGIKAGKDQKDAFVFLYVKNNSLVDSLATADLAGQANLKSYAPYFYIENQWSAVTTDSAVAPKKSNPGNEEITGGHTGQTAYVDGLFMYVGDAVGDNRNAAKPLMASAADEGTSNVYTGELFEDITIPNDLGEFNVTDVLQDGDITVYAFIYAHDANAEGVDGTAAQAQAEAIAWAKKLAGVTA